MVISSGKACFGKSHVMRMAPLDKWQIPNMYSNIKPFVGPIDLIPPLCRSILTTTKYGVFLAQHSRFSFAHGHAITWRAFRRTNRKKSGSIKICQISGGLGQNGRLGWTRIEGCPSFAAPMPPLFPSLTAFLACPKSFLGTRARCRKIEA